MGFSQHHLMTKKQQYKLLCETENLPIFLQDWWLDIVCGEANWQPILVTDKNEKIIGASFYYNKSRYGISTITQPVLTPFSGVWIRPLPTDASHKKHQYEADILSEIALQLPKTPILAQHFHFSLTNILPFHWAGFDQTTRYTYIFEKIDKALIISGMSESSRQVLKKGEHLRVQLSDDVKTLFDLYKMALNHSKSTLYFDFKTLNLLYSKAKEKNQCQIIQISDDNEVLASCLLIWDATTAYLSLIGNNRKHPSAATRLIFEAIGFLQEKNISILDFDGSMLQGVEKFFRSFGAVRKPYFRVTRAKNKFWKILSNLRES